jgi:protein SCO1/2
VTRRFLPLLAIVLAAGTAALGWATEGFQTVTRDGAQRLAVERAPLLLPDVRLVDQDGHSFSLADYRGRRVLVDFIYTRCPTICGVLGDDFARVAARSGRAVDLVSISFDPQNDDREARQFYAERFGAAAPGWRVAVPADRDGLDRELRAFGVVVVPDGRGGFVHDGRVYFVDASGRLADIIDAPSGPLLAAEVRRP